MSQLMRKDRCNFIHGRQHVDEGMMFDPTQLKHVLDLQDRSFRMLKWVRDALQSGGLSFSVVHSSVDTSSAASEWIERHLANIPRDIRPANADVPMFARLFVSYLTTSFRLVPLKTRLVSQCGCYCSWCAYLRATPSLEMRAPSKRDFQTARELKKIYLDRLAQELHLDNPAAAVDRVLGTVDLHQPVALATWAAEILRRSEFASQGEAVLALWREFAWDQGRLKQAFGLRVEAIIAAERSLIASLH